MCAFWNRITQWLLLAHSEVMWNTRWNSEVKGYGTKESLDRLIFFSVNMIMILRQVNFDSSANRPLFPIFPIS